MISIEVAHFIAKFYLVSYFVVFLLSIMVRKRNKSNLIILGVALCHLIVGQFSKMAADFYTYYLAAAFGCMLCVIVSLCFHLRLRVKHTKTTIIAYCVYMAIALSYLIIHRVRVGIYETDAPIMWLINLQSYVTLSLYFLSICIFIYGAKPKWNLFSGRLYQ